MTHLGYGALLLALACLESACAQTPSPPLDHIRSRAELAHHLKTLAGTSGINCGAYPPSSAHKVLDCASDALQQKSGFWLINESHGIDDTLLTGIAGDPAGAVWQISYAEFHNKNISGVLSETKCLNPHVVMSPEPSFNCR